MITCSNCYGSGEVFGGFSCEDCYGTGEVKSITEMADDLLNSINPAMERQVWFTRAEVKNLLIGLLDETK